MEYLGGFKAKKKKYVVTKDEANALYNIFYKDIKEKIVDCFSFPIDMVEREKGETELKKIQAHWNRAINTSQSLWAKEGIFPNAQTFPMEFWDDIIMALKKGSLGDMEFKIVKQ